MLYELQLPDSARYLDWIVALQRCMLAALCQPATQPIHVDQGWVEQCSNGLQPDLEWLQRFCRWNVKGKSILDLMREIAAFPPDAKDAVMLAFENDINTRQAFDAPPHNLIGLECLNAACAKPIQEFCERFYEPGLSRGYRVPDGTQYVDFDREEYVSDFRGRNKDITVCPYCDGHLPDVEIDHFYPESKYPYLSCHHLNLVPVCHECNKPGVKHLAAPLTLTALDQTSDWFHPYLRSAANQYVVKIHRDNNQTFPALFSNEAQTQTRLDNLAKLVKLKPRWRQQLRIETSLRQRDIERETKKRKHILDEAELCDLFQEWAERVEEVERGFIGFALLRHAYLQSVAQKNLFTFEEARVFAQNQPLV